MKATINIKYNLDRILIILFCIFCSTLSFAQSPTQSENYVLSRQYLTSTGNPDSTMVDIMYLDGLGREKQSVSHKSTPAGKDIIVKYTYDSYGRQVQQYLPAATQQSSGGILSEVNANTAYTQYYDPRFGTDIYFSEKELESSALGRPLRQSAPGEEWKMDSGKEIKFDYQFNLPNEVKLYAATTAWDPVNKFYKSTLTHTGYYERRELVKTITTDENGNKIHEYKNKKGQVVLVRSFVSADSAPAIPGSGTPKDNVDTYNVYDEYGNLTYVIPPLASAKTSITSNVMKELCYQYRYDSRNRMVERRLPGKGWEHMVYDKQDRLVATQDSLMRRTDFSFPSGTVGKGWAFTKYDQYGRVVYAGLYKGNETRLSLQNLVDGYLQNNEARSTTTFAQNGITVYYTRTGAFPKNHTASNVDLLTVNYYDTNYTNLLPTGVSPPSSIEGQSLRNGTHSNKSHSLKGLPVASFARIIPGNDWEKAYTFYDARSRPVGTYKFNHLGGYTKLHSKLDFRGKPEFTKTFHKRTGTGTEIEIRENFTYDQRERLIKHTHKIGSGAEQLISLNVYNPLGQLENKRVGGTDLTGTNRLQKVDYRYNIRGWLTDINNVNMPMGRAPGDPPDPYYENDLFSFRIHYNDFSDDGAYAGLPALYNGNISQTLWKTSSDNALRSYVYGFDELNRMREANYLKPGEVNPFIGTYDERVTYDLNGNIKALSRNAGYENQSLPDEMDVLTYTYATDSNKLTKVVDDGLDGTGFIDGFTAAGVEYTYDGNANMTSDKNKGITSIKYNHLNLPTDIYWESTKKINYLYNASGQKVKKTVTNGTVIHTTDYLDGFQYYNTYLEFFPHAEGYVKNTQMSLLNTYDYVFNYIDHLGNIRLSYAKDPSSGELKIMEENHYYPFGLKHQKYTNPLPREIVANEDETTKAIIPTDPVLDATAYRNYDYKYNGKEWQDELGLNMYDMDMRMYDPALARWVVMDPVIHHSMSPYNAFDNNPVFWADPSGADGEQQSTGSPDATLVGGIKLSSFAATTSSGFAYVSSDSYESTKKNDDNDKNKNNNPNNKDPNNKDPKNGDPKNKEEQISKADKKRGSIIKEKEKKEQDNNYNFFYKEKDKWLRRGAEFINDGGATENSIAVNSHGNNSSISTPEGWMKPLELHNYLYENNDLYKSSFDNKTTINIRLNACNTGNGFSEEFSVINPYINVTAPTTSIKGVFNTGGTWVTYNNGSMID